MVHWLHFSAQGLSVASTQCPDEMVVPKMADDEMKQHGHKYFPRYERLLPVRMA